MLINNTVLMSDVDNFDDSQPINPFMDSAVAIDLAAAKHEHSAIRVALESAGVKVLQVASPTDSQDGVFTANWALVRNGKAVMARLPNARKAEEPYAEQILHNLGIETTTVPGDYKFSGQGDSLPCGDYLFCGSNYRSDPEAQAFVAEALGFERIQLQAVPLLSEQGQPVINAFSGFPDSFYYDLDLAISVLEAPSGDKKGLIAWCPAAFVPESQEILRNFDGVDKIEVSEHEAMHALACNLVSTGEVVVMNDGAPEFVKKIEAHGLKTILLSNPELAKGGGSMRCTTLTLN